MKKTNILLVATAAFFAGAFTGLLLSPIKGTVGSNNGNTTINNYGKKDDDLLDDTADLEALDGAE